MDKEYISLKEYFELAHNILEKRVLILEQDSRELRESKAELQGKADTKSVNTVFIMSGIAIVLGVLDLLLRFFSR